MHHSTTPYHMVCQHTASRGLHPAQVVAELMQISAEQRSMAVQQLQRFSAHRQSAVDLTRCAHPAKPHQRWPAYAGS